MGLAKGNTLTRGILSLGTNLKAMSSYLSATFYTKKGKLDSVPRTLVVTGKSKYKTFYYNPYDTESNGATNFEIFFFFKYATMTFPLICDI